MITSTALATARDTDCGRLFKFGDHRCKRTIKHPGLHRNARRMQEATVMWGDNECAPEGGTQ